MAQVLLKCRDGRLCLGVMGMGDWGAVPGVREIEAFLCEARRKIPKAFPSMVNPETG